MKRCDSNFDGSREGRSTTGNGKEDEDLEKGLLLSGMVRGKESCAGKVEAEVLLCEAYVWRLLPCGTTRKKDGSSIRIPLSPLTPHGN